MKLWLFVLIFAASSVSLVSCGCRSPWKEPANYESVCEEWWQKAHGYSSVGSDRRGCVKKIIDKCPEFLRSFNEKHKLYQRVKSDKLKWIITSEAIRNDDDVLYYDSFKTTAICMGDDQGLGNCYFWWRAAVHTSSVNKIVDRCIGLVEKHCPEKLTEMSKTTQDTKYNGKPVTVVSKTCTYEGQMDVLSFRRYIYN